jgi:hypothetical protein
LAPLDETILDADCQDAGCLAVEVFLRKSVIRVIFQSGIVDPVHFRMLLLILLDSQCVGCDPVEAQCQGFDAVQDQETVERESAAPVLRKGTTRARPM